MKPATIFALAVRLLGLLFVYNAVQGLSSIFLAPLTIVHELILGAAAAWCFFGAPPVQRWAFPESQARPMVVPPPTAPETGPACVNCGKNTTVGASVCPHCGWTQPK